MFVHLCICAVCRAKSTFPGLVGRSCGSHSSEFATIALAFLLLCPGKLTANERNKYQVVPNHLYFFGGLDIARDSSFSWFGATTAPSGTLDEDGTRMRLLGGYGHYRYRANALPGGENNGETSAAEIQIGKRLSFNPILISAYIGVEIKSYRLELLDPDNPANGIKYGAKGALEMYTRLDPNWFATAYGNISSVYNNYSARVSINHNLGRYFTLGVEGGMAGDYQSNEMRAGLIGGFVLGKTIFTLAGGLLHASDSGKSFYTTFTAYAPF